MRIAEPGQRKLGREMIGDADHFRLFDHQLGVGKEGERFAAQPLNPSTRGAHDSPTIRNQLTLTFIVSGLRYALTRRSPRGRGTRRKRSAWQSQVPSPLPRDKRGSPYSRKQAALQLHRKPLTMHSFGFDERQRYAPGELW